MLVSMTCVIYDLKSSMFYLRTEFEYPEYVPTPVFSLHTGTAQFTVSNIPFSLCKYYSKKLE